MRFSIIMTVYETWDLLPRALACLSQQTWTDWEAWLMIDGPAPSGPQSPRKIVRRLQKFQPECALSVIELPRAEGCFGNVGRHVGLTHATGDYVCWINHDNLVSPEYLATHARNIESQPGCISVVRIDYWRGVVNHGPFPRRHAIGHLDLLNFSVPLELARQVNAFGPEMQTTYAADWLTYDACRQRAPVVESKQIVGTHF